MDRTTSKAQRLVPNQRRSESKKERKVKRICGQRKESREESAEREMQNSRGKQSARGEKRGNG